MAPMYRVKQRPNLNEVAGRFMTVSQFAEPKRYNPVAKKFSYATWDDLDDKWWEVVAPSLFEQKEIHWGESTWLINHDGTLTFSGANYDSSG